MPMNIPALFFAVMALAFFLLWVRTTLRSINLVDNATREHRIALTYLGARRVSLPDQFVDMHMAGDHARLSHYFPDYPRFRQAAIEREQEQFGNG